MADKDHDARMNGMIARMEEIEAMAGQEMSQREIFKLQAEHSHLALVIADAECRRLTVKLAQYEHRDRVLDAFDRMDRDDLRVHRERKAAVERSGRKRL